MKKIIQIIQTIHRKNFAVLLLIYMLFVTACAGVPSSDYEQLYTGTEGVVIDYLPESPREVYNQDEFINLEVQVSNKGRYNNPEGAVFIDGFDKQALFFSSTRKQPPALEAKSSTSKEGGVAYLPFEENLPVQVPYGDHYTTVLQATSCYKYQTIATLNACIIPEVSDIGKKKTYCTPGITRLESQAAPVAVTQVEERVARDIVQFIITVENVGDGRVINADKLDYCPYQLEPRDIDHVFVTAEIGTLGEADCTSNKENTKDNLVRLFDGKGVIICKFVTRPDVTSYETPLRITLDYGYSSTIKKEIEIFNPEFIGVETK